MSNFKDLGLDAPILSVLETEGYASPTPIQAQAIPEVLTGRDLLGIAQTGTGKTAAFALPMLQRLAADRRRPARGACRALVLSPTRELASQIAESFRTYGRNMRLSVAVVFGGVSFGAQARTLSQGVDILIATPGRLMDHMGQRTVRLDQVEILVLDEADQMLDMGFIHAIRQIVRVLPAVRQNLFFSATMPREIDALAADLLRNPARVAVTPVASTVERIDQQIIMVDTARKRMVLTELLQANPQGRILVFTRTKHGADRVAEHLTDAGIESAAIHGNKSQGQRERALGGFRGGRCRVLVATDIAARGIDVDGITHVVNFDLPHVPESYVHRIGRTARAGAEGVAIALCSTEEMPLLRDIERLIRLSLPRTERRDNPRAPAAAPTPQRGRPNGKQGRPGQKQGHQQRTDARNDSGSKWANGRNRGNRQGQGRGRGRDSGSHATP